MKSQWFEYKDQAFTLRKSGYSIKRIEAYLGIPRSTLSGWFKNLEISEEHKSRLMKNKEEAWTRARLKAAESHRAQKALRMLEAERAAKSILVQLDINNPEILDLAFAMLYLGEGAKNNSSSIASSDPMILKFVIAVLVKNYDSKLNDLFCDLHLRADQSPEELKQYWSNELDIPIENFKSVSIDLRTKGRPTYERYKGVCVLRCGSVSIQRKLIYLYNAFCRSVIEQMGA